VNDVVNWIKAFRLDFRTGRNPAKAFKAWHKSNENAGDHGCFPKASPRLGARETDNWINFVCTAACVFRT